MCELAPNFSEYWNSLVDYKRWSILYHNYYVLWYAKLAVTSLKLLGKWELIWSSYRSNVRFIGLVTKNQYSTFKHQMSAEVFLSSFHFENRRGKSVLFSFQKWNDDKKLRLTFTIGFLVTGLSNEKNKSFFRKLLQIIRNLSLVWCCMLDLHISTDCFFLKTKIYFRRKMHKY